MPDNASAADRWRVQIRHMHDAPSDDLTAVTTPAERLAMAWELTARMWALTGRPVPSYERADIPIRVIRA